MAEEEAEIFEQAKKLPISERISHSNWKVRVAAFEDIRDKCHKVFDDGDPLLNEFVGLFPKAVTDTNAATLDKALEALLSFLGKCSEQHANRIVDKTCSNMVTKCLSGRPGTVAKSSEVFLAFVEQEQGERVLAALIEGFNHKVPKAAVAALDILHQAISAFGAKVIPAQPILKAAPPIFDSKDAKARSKIKDIVLEIARWIGADVIRATLLSKVRDVIKSELETALDQLAPERPRPERVTRKDLQEEAGADEVLHKENGASAAVEEDVPMEADAYEFVDAKDIMPDLKKDFWEGLESKKWSDRKAALSTLRELASYPKLAPGDSFELFKELKKIITKDSNVQVVAEAILCCGMLAKGLRASYSSTARGLCPVLLDKFKEKNANVKNAVLEALTHMHKHCFAVPDVVEDIAAALGHTNPKVKEESVKWLTEAISRESKQSLTKAQAMLLPAIGKCAEDAAPSLREVAMSLLVAYAVKLGSAAPLEKVISKLDDAKKKKVEELFEEAMKSRSGKKAAPKPSAASAPAPAASSRPASRAPEPRPTTARPAARSGAAKPAEPKPKANAAKDASAEVEDEASLSSGMLSKEEVEEKFTGLFGESTTKSLQDSQWKVRLEAMESILMSAESMPENCSVLVQGIGHLPGWNEKISQVMAKQFELIALLAKDAPTFSKRDAFCCIPGLVDKIADPKLSGVAMEALSNIAEAVGPQFVCSQLHKKAASHKNPKVLCNTVNFIARAIDEFGLRPMNVKALLDWVKEDLGSTNAPVRTAATSLLGVMHRFLGAPLGEMLRADVKPALMTAIEAEFSKNPQTGGHQPIRVSRVETSKAAPAASGKQGSSKGAAKAVTASVESFDPDELLPRTDISSDVQAEVLGRLSSANWKERKEAMDALDGILQAAGYRIQPQVGELFSVLKPRMSDTNRNLTVQALQLVGKLAKSMGRAVDRQSKVILGPALKNLSDPKILVRAAVMEMLEAWSAAAPVDSLVAEVVEALAAPKCSGEGKKSGLEWLANLAATGKVGGDSIAESVKAAAVGSMDKAVEVREASSKLMTALIENIGASEVGQASHTLGTANKKAALELYAKVTGGSAPSSAMSSASSSMTRATSVPRSTNAPSRSSTSSLPSSSRSNVGKSLTASSRLRPSSSVAASSMNAVGAGSNDDGPAIKMDDKKEERARKGRFKPAKFEIKSDEASSLEVELRDVVSPSLLSLMTHKDFKKHIEATDIIKSNLDPLLDHVISCLDLLLRWAVLRVLDANTQTLVKVLDMLKLLFELLVEREYRLTDYEAKMLVPALVEKSGHNQDRIRADHRDIMRKVCTVYSPIKTIAYIKDGLDSKNNRTRVECAEEIGCIIDRSNLPLSKFQEAIHACAKLVAERDTNLRKAVLATMEVVYDFEGEDLWKLMGRLTDQQKSLIEERLKYVDRQLAKKGLRPGYRKAEVEDDTAPSVASSVAASRIGVGATAFGGSGAQAFAGPSGSQNNSPTKDTKDQSTSLRHNAPSASLPHLPSISLQGVPPAQPSYQHPTVHTSLDSSPAQPGLMFSKKSDDEMQTEFVRAVSTLRSGSVEDSVEAMKSLCYQLMELPRLSPQTVQVFKTNIDELVRLLAAKTDAIFIQATLYPNGKDVPNARACKYSLNTLMNIFQSKALPANISENGIRELISVLLMRILDSVLPKLSEGQSMLKAVNVLMLKVLDNSNRTYSFGALISLLLNSHQGVAEAAPEENMEHRWSEVVVKCLIKLTKTMSQYIETINARQLLFYVHNYFHQLGHDEVMARGNREDKPLRMVKTVLHELCRLKGKDIYNYVDAIPHLTPNPLIFTYIELNLNTLGSRGAPAGVAAPAPAAAAVGARMAGGPAGSSYGAVEGNGSYGHVDTGAGAVAGAYPTRTSAAGVSTSTNSDAQARNTLASIFKRIGDKKEPEQALRELDRFMVDCPHIDVNLFLNNASEQFRTYIHKGLAKVRAMDAQGEAARAQEAQAAPTTSEVDSSTAAGMASSRAEAPGLAELRDRMNKIQGDLSNTQAGMTKAPDRTVQDIRERMRAMQSRV